MQQNITNVLNLLPCVQDYTINESFNHTLYTISASARYGGRTLMEWIKTLQIGPKFVATKNEYFELELVTPISINARSSPNLIEMVIKSRLIADRRTNELRMLVKPFVVNNNANCDIMVLNQLCKCALNKE
jgi:hypothetical protein